MDSIRIGDQSIPYVFVEKPWVRNTYMKFDDQKLIVTASSFAKAVNVVNKHKGWIYKHYSQVKSTIRLFRHSSILFNGSIYDVQHVPANQRARIDIMQNMILVNAKDAQAANRALDKWLALQTALFTNPLVTEKVRMLGREMPDTRTRRFAKWGVCKSNNTITFNAYLCMLPRRLQEYIVSHEVAHLSQMNHSRKFWEVVYGLCPDYRSLRKELRNYDSRIGRLSTVS
ncbi:MAG: DUF45 domain-containing protein [Candidatus Micrarchaeota archaeon]|nr:DUF45 domain-containing protein [Candidatus Micrarchaeota archaeon]MDE1833896.1 DUF45 domain-containing protein [Candidatus Micrarchaeota archaeon]MDE1860006.1 DUF45 domain-containing protein [Candidatus Micrarchaeota archaeon]